MTGAPLLAAALAALLPAWGASAQERIAIFSELGTPVIATEVLLATGPADEDSAQAGLAYLAARAVTEPLRPLLDSLDAHLAVSAQKDALSFSLTAAPDAWEEVSRALLVALFRDPVDSLAVVRERRAVAEELLGREANPTDAVAREADAAFFGRGHPWARATVGSAASVQGLSLSEVNRFLRAHFTPERAVVVVVGPIEPERARAHLGGHLTVQGPIPFERVPARPERSPVRRDYNTITTWVSTSFPVPEGTDEEALRLAAYLTRRELALGPGRHRVYDVRSEVIPRRGGGEVRFQVAIPPQEAGRWADRIEETVRGLSEAPMPKTEWDARLRRYRGERLLELSAPESRAHEAARRLLVTGRAERPIPELDELSPARVRARGAGAGHAFRGLPGTVSRRRELDKRRGGWCCCCSTTCWRPSSG